MMIGSNYWDMAVCQNLVPLAKIKIAGKWMVIPLKMVLIGIDPYPYKYRIVIRSYPNSPKNLGLITIVIFQFHIGYNYITIGIDCPYISKQSSYPKNLSKSPSSLGGGFLGGAQAQEESLARSSGLYPCLTKFQDDMSPGRKGGFNHD